MKKERVFYNCKKIDIPVMTTSFFGRFKGLMFKNADTNNLLFEFSRDVSWSIHSFFVKFNFLAVWLDSKNNVVDFKIVRPYCPRVRLSRKYKKLIEIPLNQSNRKIISFFVGKGKI